MFCHNMGFGVRHEDDLEQIFAGSARAVT